MVMVYLNALILDYSFLCNQMVESMNSSEPNLNVELNLSNLFM